jgi:VWFA-related protein
MRWPVLLAFALVMSPLTDHARAQQPAPAPVPGPPAATGLDVRLEALDISRFPLLRTFLSVIDPVGKAVNTFERRSFQLSEQGQLVRLDVFKIDRSPLACALVLDSSGSMLPALLDLKRAVTHFIRVLEPYDQAMLMTFSDIPRVLVPWTLDQDRLVQALGPLDAYGPTALYDAIHKGVLELSGMPGRRVMLLLTDGQDQNTQGTALQSRHSLKEALALAIANQVVIHVVALGRFVNFAELELIARETRGELYKSPRSRDLEDLYVLISRNLKSRMELTYRTPNPRVDGTWRVHEVKVSAGGMFGSDQASYRAPGRYVVELPGQGFDRLRAPELAKEIPPLRLRDLNMKEILLGGKKEIGDWIDSYFKR